MKTFSLIILELLAGNLTAQTKLDKTVPVQSGQKVNMRFDYPELIRVSTWEKNEISIQGTVSINGGENDDAFTLDISTSGNSISIRNEIKGMEDLPQRVTVTKDGQKMTFRTKGDWQKYKEEHGGKGFNSVSQGTEMDITLDIKVPRNMETFVESVYGMVEVKGFTGPLKVQATYGGIDASLTESTLGELVAETNYGHIYSDLSLKFNKDNVRDEDFHTYVSTQPGVGPKYSFESAYGNVYLRKNK